MPVPIEPWLRVNTQSAESCVGDVHTVRYVEVFQTRTTRDRGICTACPAAIGPWRHIEKACDVAWRRYLRIEGIAQVRARRGGTGIDGYGVRAHFYGLGRRAGCQLHSQAGGASDRHLDIFDVRWP